MILVAQRESDMHHITILYALAVHFTEQEVHESVVSRSLAAKKYINLIESVQREKCEPRANSNPIDGTFNIFFHFANNILHVVQAKVTPMLSPAIMQM